MRRTKYSPDFIRTMYGANTKGTWNKQKGEIHLKKTKKTNSIDGLEFFRWSVKITIIVFRNDDRHSISKTNVPSETRVAEIL